MTIITTKLYCLAMAEVHVCEQLAQGWYRNAERPRLVVLPSSTDASGQSGGQFAETGEGLVRRRAGEHGQDAIQTAACDRRQLRAAHLPPHPDRVQVNPGRQAARDPTQIVHSPGRVQRPPVGDVDAHGPPTSTDPRDALVTSPARPRLLVVTTQRSD